MDMKAAKEAYSQAKERNREFYEKFQSEFEKQIAEGEPEAGVTRIQLLEELIRKMNRDIMASNMKYVASMIESLDEEAIINSKKENS